MIKRALILILFLVAAISCDTVEVIDYTYSIDKVWWTDKIDGNQDGYAQFKRLNFIVILKEGVTRKIQARIYYKPADASTPTLYGTTPETEVTGNETDNNLFFSIGAPNKELSRGLYDFSVEIYEANNSMLEAQTDSQHVELFNNKFEESGNDNPCHVRFWWSNSYDRNGNTYWRYSTMNINVYSDKTYNKKVDVKIFFKKSTAETFKLFQSKNDYQVKGEFVDTLKYVFGLPELKLTHDQYDFRIEIYRSDIDALVAIKNQEDPLLNDIEFESDEEDSYHYKFSKVWWSNPVDVDGDMFTQYRDLNFDVDVEENENRIVYAKLYYLHPDSTDYTFYDSTAIFTIRGISTSDKYTVGIGTTKTELDSNRYNFLISIYEILNITDKSVEASVSGDIDTLLYKQKFETLMQDALKKKK
ncbi:MAG: choice-of-anchor H family protein [Melioribacteraceae bacterium]